LADALRDKALAFVNDQLIAQGLIAKDTGKVTPAAQEEFGYKRTTSVPTAGIIVKGCMDTCSICESTVEKREELELARLELENQLLAKQIELLEKSQEYRCCAAGTETS
jgi:hypothetical protein